MLCRSVAETIKVVVLGCVSAKCKALIEIIVDFPTCRPAQIIIRLELSRKTFSW